MNTWNYGYFTESTYTYGYYRELNPVFQKFCLLAKSFAAPEANENENYCELGFGQGVSLNIHAAANLGNFFGTDFNPAHAAHANELCSASGSGGKFFDDSFEEMLNRSDLPRFDSINLHGIWSWISTENQKIIVEFARKFLNPGGTFYNSYNCYPGWSPAAPLRELFVLHDKYAQKSKKTYERVEEAMKFTEELLAKKPAYFGRVPDVAKIFESTRKHDHDYLAHEYFNRDWICMYFTDVVELLEDAKLEFTCTAEVVEALEHLSIQRDALDFLNQIEAPVMREQVKDYFINRQFRKDIFIRGARRISAYERITRLMNTNYVLMSTDPLPEKFQVAVGEISLAKDVCDKIREHLASQNYRPKNFSEFLKKNQDISAQNIEQILIILVHNGNVAPCQPDAAAKLVKPKCDALNKYFCTRAKNSGDINFMASPITGGGITVNRFEQLFLGALADGKKSANTIASSIWEILSEQGQALLQNGKRLETPEENIAQLKDMAQDFLDKRLPILKALQIA
ncbi:MAG: class I SAM-dependent methyltransferase [Selenomonadaceae bacterium]|nr:class I SAM-dependent methyltransferase [Selenomonadaceae bacterium]